MGVQIHFDPAGVPLLPHLILATRSGRLLREIPVSNVRFMDTLTGGSEFSFTVHKGACLDENGETDTAFWKKITDFRLAYCRDFDRWYELKVDITESTSTSKSVSARSLGEAELSQINVYGIEVNTEADIERADYEPTVLYDDSHPEKSLIDRLLYKAPHYRVEHVDESICNVQRTFSFDGKTVYDSFSEISQEIGCLFLLDCREKENGGIDRTISAYDLEYHCPVCGQRGEYMPVCTNCGNTTLPGYGTDTSVFVSRDNLAQEITYTTNTDEVKNCFRLEAGDDLMTASIVACNPNGSQYIWYVTDETKADMSPELLNRLEDYDALYEYYQTEASYSPPEDLRNAYNDIVREYQYTWRPDEALSEKTMPSSITGYPALMKNYFDSIDLQMFLESELMPSTQTSTTDAEAEAAKLTSQSLSPVAVANVASCTADTAANAVVGMAKCIVRGTYQVKAIQSSISTVGSFKSWTGKLQVTNYGNEEDTAETGSITVTITDDLQRYIQQKIDRMINQTAEDPTDISALFQLPYASFVGELKKYCRQRLLAFRDACQAALDILIQQGVADAPSWVSEENNLYQNMYIPYLNRMRAIEAEIGIRSEEIRTVAGTADENGGILEDGMQTVLKRQIDSIRADLNFENYLGTELWQEFAGYRREDIYKNDNYISDGLSNYDLMVYAERFLNKARQEIFKSATMQHSIQANMANLLAMEEFQPLKQKFRTGNWIRIQADGDVYRLRLSEYTVDYDSWNLDVTFTDLKQGYSAASDLQSMLSAVKSMQTTYGAVTRQAKDGEKGLGILDRWVNEGMALTTNIVGGAENQEFTMDETGFTGKELIPETGEYSPEQVKIISHGVYMTDDGWVTAKAAIGRFRFLNPQNHFREEEAFGVIADKLVGNLVLSQSIGIYNADGTMTMDNDGFTLITEHTGNQKVFNIKRHNQDDSYSDIVSLDASGNLVLSAYSTTGEMNSAIETSANGIRTYVGDNYSTKANTVKSVTVEYIVWDYGDDQHAPPNNDSHWSTETPVWTSGKYIWQHTKTTNGSDAVSYSTPACIQGASGHSGQDGYNTAIVYLYQRATSAPSAPSGTLTYTFSTGVLSGTLGSWSQTIPTGTNPIYVIAATAASRTDTDTIASNEWSSAVVLAQNGEDGQPGSPGTNGLNSATVRLYQRAASAPSAPGGSLTYTFATGVLSGDSLGNWSQTIPATDGNPCWVTQATAVANTATDSIASNEWSAVAKLVEDGEDGQPGTNGYNTAVVYLYQRATSAPSVPSETLTYTFATGVLSGTLGSWSQDIPNGTDPIYVIAATAASRAATDTIASNEWSSAVVLAQNGEDGQPGSPGTNGLNSATVRLYQRAESAPSKPSETLTYTFATGILANIPTGWSQSIPASNGDPCWVTQATAVANMATDDITGSEWSAVAKLVEDGTQGDDGIGISSIEPEYYLSTSDQSPTGGSWSADQPEWENGKYIWTRSKITWDDSTQAQPHITYTDAVLESAINGANEQAYATNQTLITSYSSTTQTQEMISSEVGKTTIELIQGGVYGESTNLCPYPLIFAGTANSYTVIDNKDGIYDITKNVTNGKMIRFYAENTTSPILPAGTYTFAITERGTSANLTSVFLSYKDSSWSDETMMTKTQQGDYYIYTYTATFEDPLYGIMFTTKAAGDSTGEGYRRTWKPQINIGESVLEWEQPTGSSTTYTTRNLCPWPMDAKYLGGQHAYQRAPVNSNIDGTFSGTIELAADGDGITLGKSSPGFVEQTYSIELIEEAEDQDFYGGTIQFYNGRTNVDMTATQTTEGGVITKVTYRVQQTIPGDASSIAFRKTGVSVGGFHTFKWKIMISAGSEYYSWEIPSAIGAQYSISEAYSKISQTESSIELKVDKDGIISAINMSPEQITIDASRVNITGYLTVSDVSSTGTVEIYGGRIKGGMITLGGANNGNGQLRVVNASNQMTLAVTNSSFIYYCRSSTVSFYIKDGNSNNLLTANSSGLNVYCRSASAGLYLMDSSNNTLMAANSNGITVYKGLIQGPSIVVGGLNNQNGTITVKDANNSTTTTINNDGITTSSLTADSYIYCNGNTSSYFKIPMSSQYVTGAYLEISTNGFQIHCSRSTVYFGQYGAENDFKIYSSTSGTSLFFAGGFSSSYGSSSTTINAGDITCDYLQTGDIYASGDKTRIVQTQNYGVRKVCAFEAASPMFMDAGSAVIAETGDAYIFIEQIFLETVETTVEYQVFLQKYGDGDCWVEERSPEYFIVKGTPGLSFGWEIHAKQRDYDQYRLEEFGERDLHSLKQMFESNCGTEAADFIENYYKEIETV